MAQSGGVDFQGQPFVGRDGIERRRIIVLDLKLRGMTIQAIAAILKVHRNTVRADLSATKRDQAKAYKNMDPDAESGSSLAYYEKLRDQAYQNYVEADKDAVKLGFLQVALRAEEMRNKLMMDLGVVAKVPSKVGHTGQISLSFQGVPTEDLELRRKTLLQELSKSRGN